MRPAGGLSTPPNCAPSWALPGTVWTTCSPPSTEDAGGDAQSIVHEVREKAGRLGCRFLAARSLDLELALRAGADTQVVYGRYASAVPDTLCAITAYLS